MIHEARKMYYICMAMFFGGLVLTSIGFMLQYFNNYRP